MKIFLLLLLLPLVSAERAPSRVGKYYKKPNLGLITFGLHENEKLIKLDKQRILDMINSLRNYLAQGKETYSMDSSFSSRQRMPKAADMEAMSWDDNLALYAQNWTNQELGNKHSSLKNNAYLKDYEQGILGENICADITAQERDMYGEVGDWNYDTFACRPDKNCGHYLTIANAQTNHVGCGYRKYVKSNVKYLIMVCVFGGNNPTPISDGETRLPWQHEYTKGEPCSLCKQGWDYCMGGGLCATKKQCESDPSNCKCLHSESECQSNGGTFDGDACTCTCPAEKMGINCAQDCADTNKQCLGSCDGTSSMAYTCEKRCGSCGKAQSSAFKWSYVSRQAPNAENILVRATFEDPDAVSANKPVIGNQNCKNEDNANCQKLKYRGYCTDHFIGSIAKDRCKKSCGVACKEPAPALQKSDFDNLLKGMGVNPAGGGGGGDLGDSTAPKKGADAASALSKMSGMGDLSGLGDLSGFSVFRRRRR